MTKDVPKTIAALTADQRNYLCGHYGKTGRKGNPRGLIQRGLLRYAWGMDSAMGYKDTDFGRAVYNGIQKEQK